MQARSEQASTNVGGCFVPELSADTSLSWSIEHCNIVSVREDKGRFVSYHPSLLLNPIMHGGRGLHDPEQLCCFWNPSNNKIH